MLVEIRCDKFAEEFRSIRLNAGLNTVLGSTRGDNALGKSTFLWLIDYAFGGDSYCSAGSDIKKNVKEKEEKSIVLRLDDDSALERLAEYTRKHQTRSDFYEQILHCHASCRRPGLTPLCAYKGCGKAGRPVRRKIQNH